MDEPDFWASLEYRVCRELEGFEDKRLRYLGCDGSCPSAQHDIDWPALLPDEELTGWLTPDLTAKTLTMDPASGFRP